MLGHVRLNSSRTGLLAFIGLLAVTTPTLSQTHQSGIEKQKNFPRHSVQERVRRNLAEGLDDEDGIKQLFTMGDEAVPSLIKFLSDAGKDRRAGAARGLAYIGNQQGMQALRNAVTFEKDEETKAEMSCFLAGGLVQTKSENDLDFLRSSVEKARFADDDEEVPAFCAVLALGMRGTSDSLAILRKIPKEYLIDSDEIRKAIQWMENESTPGRVTVGRSSSEEEQIKKTVLDGTFFALEERDETSVTQLTFSPRRNKALVSLDIWGSSKSAARGYHLVLAKESGVWRVVGIWFAWVA